MTIESASILVGIVLSVITLLTMLAGAVWWCAAMYTKAESVDERLKNIEQNLKEENELIWQRLNQLADGHANHETRIFVIERGK